MTSGHKITMLGTGLIGMFYTMTFHDLRGKDRVHAVYSRNEEKVKKFAKDWNIPVYYTSMEEAINDPDTDTVVIGLPNHLHKQAVELSAKAGKAILCTKPLARNALEAKELLEIVENAGVFHAYLEDLAYTPKTLKSLASVKRGDLGRILWVRSREAHNGPHSEWFWDVEQAGGGAIIDLGCHCIEIARNFIGKNIKPLEVMCWTDTQVHPIEAEDNGIGLVKYENGAIGQFEVSWTFRGGMDLRDEVSGTEGSIWLDHFLRTGYEMFTTGNKGGYVAEKSESNTGWLFPVGDEVHELGYVSMFNDVFNAMDNGTVPMESFYDGYIVNAIMDACYRSAKTKKWATVHVNDWRGMNEGPNKALTESFDADHFLVKKEIMPDGQLKLILKEKKSGKIIERIVKAGGNLEND